MFETKKEIIDYCRFVVQCLVNNQFDELAKRGILNHISKDEIIRLIKEYDDVNPITMPTDNYFNEIDIFTYKDNSGYFVEIDMFFDNQRSDLTLQIEMLKNGTVIIYDLHVL